MAAAIPAAAQPAFIDVSFACARRIRVRCVVDEHPASPGNGTRSREPLRHF
jgi:hypothetical protein